jgi:hypothetical protein
MTVTLQGSTSVAAPRPPDTAEVHTAAPAPSTTASIWIDPEATTGDAYTSRSAPRLSAPDPEEIAAWYATATTNANMESARATGETLKSTNEQRDSMRKDSLDKRRVAQEKEQDAIAKQGESKIASWFRTVFGLIGAALGMVGAIVTGGWAIGAAVVGLTLALLDLSNQIAHEAGATVTGADGKTKALELSIGGMVAAIVEQQEKDGTISFKDDKARQEWITGWTITTSLIITSAVVAFSVGGMKDAAKLIKDSAKGVQSAIDKLEKTSKTAEVAARATTFVADIGEGASMAAGGGITLQLSEIQKEGKIAIADETFIVRLLEEAATYVEQNIEFIKALAERVTDATSSSSNMIRSLQDSQSRSIRAMA